MKKLSLSRMNCGLGYLICVLLLCVCGMTLRAASLTVTDQMVFHFKVGAGLVDGSGNPATNGVDVQTWQDQSGNGRHVSASSAARRPIYQFNIATNGMPGLFFDGIEDLLRRLPLDPGTVTINSLFIVFKPTSAIDNSIIPPQILLNQHSTTTEMVALGAYTGNFTDEILGTRSRDSGSNPHKMSGYKSATESIDDLAILSVIYNSTDSAFDLYLDGTSVRNGISGVDDNGFVFTNASIYLGAESTAAGFYDGHFFEVIAYSNVLSTVDRQSVEAYLTYRFTETNRVVTASAGAGGGVTPSGGVATQVGETVSFDILADFGKHIYDIKVDGISLGLALGINQKSYTYSYYVMDDALITVTFVDDAQDLTVTDNLALWLTSTTGMLNPSSAPATTGEYVEVWQDQSGNGLDFSPTYFTRQPLLDGNASPNGKPGLSFDGSNDTIRLQLDLSAASVVMAFAPTHSVSNTSAQSYLMCGGSDDYSEAIQLGSFTSSFADEIFGMRSKNSAGTGRQAGYIDAATTIDGFTIISLVHDADGDKWDVYLNGDGSMSSSQTDDNGFVLDNLYMNIGSARSQSMGFYDGHIFEMIAYTNSLSTVDRKSVESYLKFKFTSPPPPPSGSLIMIM